MTERVDATEATDRAEFEAWAKSLMFRMSRSDEGIYHDPTTEAAWLGYRKALSCGHSVWVHGKESAETP